MKLRMALRCASRLLLVAAALWVGSSGAGRGVVADADDAGESVALQEVRIRKLHLVRPDLIPYPLYFIVVC